jgi:hypothetical protein
MAKWRKSWGRSKVDPAEQVRETWGLGAVPEATANSPRSRKSGSRSPSSGSVSSKSKSSKATAPRSSKSKSSKATAPRSSKSETTRGTAPSAADIDKLDRFEPSNDAKRKQPSDVDAMGQDKRRQVVGHSYGPSAGRQIMFFVAVAVVLVVIVGGWLTLVSLFDKPPTHFADRAPWSKTPTDRALAAEQNSQPLSPASPCGEPGGEYPVPPQSPCAPPSKANGFQGNSAGQ